MNLVLIGLIILIPLMAQFNIMSTYGKYKKVKNSKKLSGSEVARKILDDNGLSNIYVVETQGSLSDHYDPTRKVIRLSHDIFHGETIAAASIAAHEVGHAIQDKDGYTFMRIRAMLFPIVRLSDKLSWILIMISILFSLVNLIYYGIALMCISLLFQFVTLPVEFDASKRAKELLLKSKLIDSSESEGVSKMLGSAALTYVASVLASLLEIARLLLIARGND